MKGLELSEKYFESYGRPMLAEQFPEVMPYVAVGLLGSGSECFGFDDDISRDHDFEPGFCIFLPGEEVVDRRTAFLLERAYAKLPQEFSGISRSRLAPVGGPRHGVFRTKDYFVEKIGPVTERLLGENKELKKNIILLTEYIKSNITDPVIQQHLVEIGMINKEDIIMVDRKEETMEEAVAHFYQMNEEATILSEKETQFLKRLSGNSET